MKRRRNKKTGEIVEYDEEVIYYRKLTPNGHEDWTPYHPKDWEDYKPVKPYIQDEKIRIAVKMWADANGYDKLWVYHNRTTISFYNEDDNNNEIVFNTMEKFGLEHLKCYTVTKLCGEEKE